MTSATAWTLLILSGIADVVWAVMTKLSEGYTKPGWTLGSLAALAAGLLLFGETLSPWRLLAILAILGGVAALNMLPG
jgi:quaternary ammonium compound-resistance protein SugE